MSCTTCAKPYNFLRKEKGCPACGFSFCSKCLNNKIFLKKLNCDAKVCAKCSKTANEESKQVIAPPDAYFKRLENLNVNVQGPSPIKKDTNMDPVDQQIWDRLNSLKEGTQPTSTPSEQEIKERLKKLKDVPLSSDAEIQERLARLRGVPVSTIQNSTVKLIPPDTRTQQEQADDLLKQYMEQSQIDEKYKDEFDQLVAGMETRLQHLKDDNKCSIAKSGDDQNKDSSEDEEDTVKKIVEKFKAEASLEIDDKNPSEEADELPFCEICNEDATLRCLGCHYLFCKRCYLDHRDDDDGCNRYEPYKPPKRSD